MSHRRELLSRLSDGRLHSGEALGRALGISRAAVWKRLQALRDLGLEVVSVPGRGYRLEQPIELLSEANIRAALDAPARAELGALVLRWEVDSTNAALLHRARDLPTGTVLIAEYQGRGRGRRGRDWFSPPARNLYLSILWRFSQGPEALAGLSLAVGLAMRAALEDVGVPGVGVKWPNDVMAGGRKLGGALIELSGEAGAAACAVVGVGINVAMPGVVPATLAARGWTDASTVANGPVSRNRLAAAVIGRLSVALRGFDRSGLSPFLAEWHRYDVLLGRPVTVHDAGVRHGISRGVGADGALRLEEGPGRVTDFRAGDASLRAARPEA